MALALGTSAFIFAQEKPATMPKTAPAKNVVKNTPTATSNTKPATVDAQGKVNNHKPNATSNVKPGKVDKVNAKMDKKHLPNATSNDKPAATDKPEGKAVKNHSTEGMHQKKAAETK